VKRGKVTKKRRRTERRRGAPAAARSPSPSSAASTTSAATTKEAQPKSTHEELSCGRTSGRTHGVAVVVLLLPRARDPLLVVRGSL